MKIDTNSMWYRSIDERFGTMEDFENLVAECKKRDITHIKKLKLLIKSTNNKFQKNRSTGSSSGSFLFDKIQFILIFFTKYNQNLPNKTTFKFFG